MNDKKRKEGVSAKEIGDFAKRYRFEVFFCLIFILACLFGIVGYFRASWSIFFASIGALLGLIFPTKTEILTKASFSFSFKQDKAIQIILGIVGLLLAIFLPFIIFFIIGLVAGRTFHRLALDSLPRL